MSWAGSTPSRKDWPLWSKFVSKVFSEDQSLFPEEFLNFIDENLFKDMNGVVEGCIRNFDENYTRKLLSDLYDSRESIYVQRTSLAGSNSSLGSSMINIPNLEIKYATWFSDARAQRRILRRR
jgi:hypothetical protein